MIDSDEELSIKVAVMMRTGELKGYSCSQCAVELQKMRNCAGDEDKPVLYHPTLGQLNICPIRLISDTVIKFLDMYDYYEKYPSAYTIRYEDANPRYWEYVKLYTRRMNDFENKQHEKRMAELNNKK